MTTSAYLNRVLVAVSSTGTADLVLGAANAPNTNSMAIATNGTQYSYILTEGLNVEWGRGVWTSGTNTLTRATVLGSIISGVAGTTKITLAGTGPVCAIDLLAEDIATFLVNANNLSDVSSALAAIDNLSVKGADIASATTTNLNTATGNFVHITGTTTITGFTLASGKKRTVYFSGALVLTNSASLALPGGANITTAAGDTAIFVGDGSNVVCVAYSRAAAITSAFVPYRFAPGAGTTVLSGLDANSLTLGYTPGNLFVTRNGQVLTNGQDYTASTGSSVTLLAASTAGDEFLIMAFTTGSVNAFNIATQYKYTVVSPTTVFTGADDNGATLATNGQYTTVFQNGRLLNVVDDYTMTGSTVTLVTAANAPDRITVVTANTVNNANVLQVANNLSDLANTTTALANLGGFASAFAASGTATLGASHIGRVVGNTGAGQTFTLPSASTYTQRVITCLCESPTLTVTSAGNIYGPAGWPVGASLVLPSYGDFVTLISDGGSWIVIGGSPTAMGGVSFSQAQTPTTAQQGIARTNIGVDTATLAKSANYTVVAADYGALFKLTSSATLAITAAATLGDKFKFDIRNTSTGVWTIDPNASETVNGLTTFKVYPGENFRVICDGSNFFTVGTGTGLVLLDTQSPSSGTSVADFTRFDSNRFDNYEFHFDGFFPVTNAQDFLIRASVDGGSTFLSTSHYYAALVETSAPATGLIGSTNQSAITTLNSVSNSSTGDGVFGVLKVQAPASARSAYQWHFSFVNSGGVVNMQIGSAVMINTTGTNAVRFVFSSSNIAGGTIRQYGISK